MKKWITKMAVVILLIALCGPAYADDIIYGAGLILDNAASRDIGRNLIADDFYVDTAEWTDMHFWTYEADTAVAPSQIEGYLWSGASPKPADATLLLSGTLNSSDYTRTKLADNVVLTTWDLYRYDFNLDPSYLLQAGTHYWIGFHFGTSYAAQTSQAWAFTVSGTGDNYWYFNGSTWTQQNSTANPEKNFDLAFQLTGTKQVPEPTTMLLLGLGLVGIAGMRRKMQR